jgi:hypothetical protein
MILNLLVVVAALHNSMEPHAHILMDSINISMLIINNIMLRLVVHKDINGMDHA